LKLVEVRLRLVEVITDLMHNDVTRLDSRDRGMLVLVINGENFDNGHFELFNFPER
jgi:hypothetical protein